MSVRTVIKSMRGTDERRIARLLSTAADDVRECVGASVAYALLMTEEGRLTCVAAAPAGRAPLPPFDPPPGWDRASVSRPWAATGASPRQWLLAAPLERAGTLEPAGVLAALCDAKPEPSDVRAASCLARYAADVLEIARENERLRGEAAVANGLAEVLEGAFAESGDAVLVLDLDGRVVRWNDACERLYGWSVREAVGSVLPMVESSARGTALKHLRQAAAKACFDRRQSMHVTASGHPLAVDVSILPVADLDGTAGTVVIVARESERTRPLDARSALADSALRRLSAPLAALTGFAQLLSREYVLRDPVGRREVVQSLTARCVEVETAMDEVRAAQRLLETGGRLSPVPLDLTRAIVESSGRVSTRREIDLAAGGALLAMADPWVAERTLDSLMRLLDANHPREVRFSVRAAACGDTSVATISVPCEPWTGTPPWSDEFGVHVTRLFAERHGGAFDMSGNGTTNEIRIVLPAAEGRTTDG
ncbi:MAG: hypothetical protein Kow0067_09340 [Coriobacteriia bacterium]